MGSEGGCLTGVEVEISGQSLENVQGPSVISCQSIRM